MGPGGQASARIQKITYFCYLLMRCVMCFLYGWPSSCYVLLFQADNDDDDHADDDADDDDDDDETFMQGYNIHGVTHAAVRGLLIQVNWRLRKTKNLWLHCS